MKNGRKWRRIIINELGAIGCKQFRTISETGINQITANRSSKDSNETKSYQTSVWIAFPLAFWSIDAETVWRSNWKCLVSSVISKRCLHSLVSQYVNVYGIQYNFFFNILLQSNDSKTVIICCVYHFNKVHQCFSICFSFFFVHFYIFLV